MAFVEEWAAVKDNKDFSKNEVEFVFNKTMTVNEKELIENCNNSMALLSKATTLAKHPYVENVEDELEKIETEKEEEENEYDKMIKQINQNKNKNKTGENNGAKVGDE